MIHQLVLCEPWNRQRFEMTVELFFMNDTRKLKATIREKFPWHISSFYVFLKVHGDLNDYARILLSFLSPFKSHSATVVLFTIFLMWRIFVALQENARNIGGGSLTCLLPTLGKNFFCWFCALCLQIFEEQLKSSLLTTKLLKKKVQIII